MATWYVRPDTSHNTVRNGTSYATAWGGWSEVVWGALGVYGVNGDQLYACGTHTFSEVPAMGAHGGTSTSQATVRGDYAQDPGVITFTTGTYYFNINRSYTTLKNITITSGNNRCIGFLGVVVGVIIQNVTFNGTGLPCIEFLTTVTLPGYNFTNFLIDRNTFNGGGGGGGSAIHWSPPEANTSWIAGLSITNNTFNKCSSARGVIVLKPLGTFGGTAPQLTTKMSDIVIEDNTFTSCGAATVEAYGPEIFGRNTGIRIARNKIYNQKMVGALGGGFALGGFIQSLTSTFGPNLINKNEMYTIAGPTGFCNPMYGSYIISNNYAENISTTTIDGCGILFDRGANGCLAFGNEFKNLTGTGVADYTSGAGIGVIYDATNITAYGNIIDGCVMGLWMANRVTGSTCNIFHNHFLNCSLVGLDGNNTTFGAEPNYARNNILTSANGTAVAINFTSGTWTTGESTNCFFNFSLGTQAIHATSVAIDPVLDGRRAPTATSVSTGGIYLGGRDFYGSELYGTIPMGAVKAREPARSTTTRLTDKRDTTS